MFASVNVWLPVWIAMWIMACMVLRCVSRSASTSRDRSTGPRGPCESPDVEEDTTEDGILSRHAALGEERQYGRRIRIGSRHRSDDHLSESQVQERLDGITVRRDEVRDKFARFMDELPRRHVVAAREWLETSLQELQNAQHQVAAARAELARRERVVSQTNGKSKDAHARFDQLWQHPRVRAVDVDEDKLLIYLKTIHISDRDRRWEIGDFCLQCGPAHGSVRTECLRSTHSYREHPFGYDFGICFGGRGQAQLVKFLSQGDYVAVVDLAVQMMSQPDRDMDGWREVSNAD